MQLGARRVSSELLKERKEHKRENKKFRNT